jgi:hypothetical protein
MRPRGSIGEIAQTLLLAAGDQPGTVVDLAHRARVSVQAARYTASRLVASGQMVRVGEARRPALLRAADDTSSSPDAALHHSLNALERSFWDHHGSA